MDRMYVLFVVIPPQFPVIAALNSYACQIFASRSTEELSIEEM